MIVRPSEKIQPIPDLTLEEAVHLAKAVDQAYPPTNLGLLARAVYRLYRDGDTESRKAIDPMLDWMLHIFRMNG